MARLTVEDILRAGFFHRVNPLEDDYNRTKPYNAKLTDMLASRWRYDDVTEVGCDVSWYLPPLNLVLKLEQEFIPIPHFDPSDCLTNNLSAVVAFDMKYYIWPCLNTIGYGTLLYCEIPLKVPQGRGWVRIDHAFYDTRKRAFLAAFQQLPESANLDDMTSDGNEHVTRARFIAHHLTVPEVTFYNKRGMWNYSWTNCTSNPKEILFFCKSKPRLHRQDTTEYGENTARMLIVSAIVRSFSFLDRLESAPGPGLALCQSSEA